ncbi:ketosteroid isomerase-like protein [Catenulispora sp. EB89]|uniref:nuclear transport factor 2 family protein n=1 Tax=Catenulispora sp. EB89 TaxID=3156257 RepID=UPI0035121476
MSESQTRDPQQVPAPADVVRAVAAGVSRLVSDDLDAAQREEQLDRLAALYGEATDVRHPFAPLGDHPRSSRAGIREHFAAARVPVESMTAVDVHVHETADPEVVITEFRYVGTTAGRPFSFPCIFVTRVRDGVIVEARDYTDHVGAARAFGQLDGLAAALAEQAGA